MTPNIRQNAGKSRKCCGLAGAAPAAVNGLGARSAVNCPAWISAADCTVARSGCTERRLGQVAASARDAPINPSAEHSSVRRKKRISVFFGEAHRTCEPLVQLQDTGINLSDGAAAGERERDAHLVSHERQQSMHSALAGTR